MRLRLLGALLVLSVACTGWAQAQPPVSTPAASAASSVDQWLMRWHDAARQRDYVGTFVVTAGHAMSSARIWHACDGQQQMERVDALTGVPRSTFRRNDQVVTFLPERRVAVRETRGSLGLFSNLLNQADASIAQFYRLQTLADDRVAGLRADVVQLVPADSLRFGYRIWTEKKSGLILKLQTLDGANAVVEQAAFSDLQLAQPLSMAQLGAQMDNTAGYQVKKTELIRTVAEQEGWVLKNPVPGFKSMSCHKRADGALPDARSAMLQWVFSDGLASVSLFVQASDGAQRSQPPVQDGFAMGATHVLTRRLGNWWITAVGEVPQPTLALFVQGLERKD